jgi:hypothetical protein
MSGSAVKAGQAYVEIATRQNMLNRGLAAATARISMFGKAVANIGGGITQSLGFGNAFSFLPGVLKVVGAAFSGVGMILTTVIGLFSTLVGTFISLLGWPALIIAGVVALGGALLYYTGAGGAALKMLGNAWQWLLDTVLPVVKAMVNALLSGDFESAATILWTSLQLLWLTGCQSLYDMWIEFKTNLLNAIDPLLQPLMEIWASLKDAALSYLDTIRSVWSSTFGWLSNSFSGISVSWSDMVQGMSDAWNDTVNWIAKKLLYLYSLFDWSVDYEAAAKDMDAQNEAKKRANREGRNKRQGAREEEAEALKGAYGGEIAQLRKNLQEEMAKVSGDAVKLKMPEAVGKFIDGVKDFAAKVPDISSLLVSKTESQGTFSGFNAAAMSGQTSDKAAQQRAEMITKMQAQYDVTKMAFEEARKAYQAKQGVKA